MLGAVNYGRDADSIAIMAGAVAGGLGGTEAVPAEWLDEIEPASRMDVAGDRARSWRRSPSEILRADRDGRAGSAAALDESRPLTVGASA